MLSSLDALALEVRYLDRARRFYETHLGLEGERRGNEVVFEVGETGLVLRKPSTIPRGGVHVHYAFATTPAHYEDWRDSLGQRFDLVEHEFGTARSLYLDDPDGHCVEIGTGGQGGEAPLTGVFEVVLEVEHLEAAVEFYTDLGFDVVDRGTDRERVRLDGPVALELWEPQLGIADAQGAVHADLTFGTPDARAAATVVEDRAYSAEAVPDGVRVRDPDGHYLTFRETGGRPSIDSSARSTDGL
jgi:catechol 2,3-dioxygenase-like lactoylglutathione lyase family enzyme